MNRREVLRGMLCLPWLSALGRFVPKPACKFWFKYVEHPRGGWAWRGGHWQLYRVPAEEIPLSVRLHPQHPLTYYAFETRVPAPGEIMTLMARKSNFDVSAKQQIQCCRLLRESFEYRFRSELTPGTRLEIHKGTALCDLLESITG